MSDANSSTGSSSGADADATVHPDSIVGAVIDAVVAEYRLGHAIDIEAIAAAHPALADELRQVLPAVLALESREITDEAGGARSPVADFPGGYVGEFRIVREIGRGGMGIVYEAEQMSLGRRVALKILPMAGVLDSRQLTRFKNEARAAATLFHPHIVPVFSVGCERGVHYYAMQFIEGRSLAELVGQLRIEAGLEKDGMSASTAVGADSSRKAVLPTESASDWLGRTLERPSGVQHDGRPAGAKSTSFTVAETAPIAGLSTAKSGHSRIRTLAAARLTAEVADALQHAHELGVVHRDIKPANLLFDQEGKVWVADFGLAQLEADAGMTMTGDVLGTLRYMSPEQARGNRTMVDGRSDVYSLGITLYELLSLRPAFPSHDRNRVLRQVIEENPPLLRSVDPHIPRDLETVVLKAIAKEPQARYSSAKELADDLRRFLADEPIRAKRATFAERTARWSRHHRSLIGAVILLLLLLSTTLAVAMVLIDRQRVQAMANWRTVQDAAAREQRLRQEAEELQKHAERRGRRIEQLLYAADLKLAAFAWEEGDLKQYVALLAPYRPGVRGDGYGGFEWDYLWRRGNQEHIALSEQQGAVHSVEFSPDGRYVAIACDDGNVLLFDTVGDCKQTPQKLMGTAEEHLTSVAFAPDGKRLAAGGYDGRIRLYDLPTGSLQRTILAHPRGQTHDVTFSPDGTLLISCGSEPVIRLWNAEDGRPRGVLRSRHEGRPDRNKVIYAVSVSPDGRLLASAGGPDDHTLVIWDLPSREEKYLLHGHDRRLTSVAFSPGGDLVATGSVDKTVRVWELARGESAAPDEPWHIFAGDHLDNVRSVAFSPDGRWLATGDWNGSIRVWLLNPQDRLPSRLSKPSAAWQAHDGRVYGIAFSPDGQRLVSCGRDGWTKLWDLSSQTQQILAQPAGHETARGIAFAEDGRYLLEAHQQAISMWDLASGRLMSILDAKQQKRLDIVVSRDGRRLFAGDGPGSVSVWDLQSRARVSRWRVGEPGATLEPRAVSPDGLMLAVTDWQNGTLWLVDTATGDATGLPAPLCNDAIFLRSGTEVAVDSLDDILIWNVAQQRKVAHLQGHHSSIECLAPSPDGQRLASGSRDRQIKMWDLENGRELYSLSSHRDDVTTLDFSPDGRSLVSGDRSGILNVWEVENGLLLCELERFSAEISHVAFSADGEKLVCQLHDSKGLAVVLDISPIASNKALSLSRLADQALPENRLPLPLSSFPKAFVDQPRGDGTVVSTNALGEGGA